jgi:hypothetical protein
MNKVVLQFWEESERGWGVRPDGCSIHLDSNERNAYIQSIYDGRGSEVPDEYERTVGDELVAFIEDSLFEKLTKDKSIRIYQHQFKNLLNMSELIIKETV